METLLPILILSAPFALLLGLAYSVSHNMSRHVDEVLLGLRGQMGKVTLRLEKMENKVDVMERRLRTQKRIGKQRLPRLLPPPAPIKHGAKVEVLDMDDTLPGLRSALRPV